MYSGFWYVQRRSAGCPDSDGDGYADLADECPDDPNKWEYGTLCIEEDEDSEITNNQNNTIENQEDTLVGQCICPDQSDGIIVSPDSDDDGIVDGCMCQNNNQNSELLLRFSLMKLLWE